MVKRVLQFTVRALEPFVQVQYPIDATIQSPSIGPASYTLHDMLIGTSSGGNMTSYPPKRASKAVLDSLVTAQDFWSIFGLPRNSNQVFLANEAPYRNYYVLTTPGNKVLYIIKPDVSVTGNTTLYESFVSSSQSRGIFANHVQTELFTEFSLGATGHLLLLGNTVDAGVRFFTRFFYPS